MRLTIIRPDTTVYMDGAVHTVEKIADVIPADVSVLQWYDGRGWIEFEPYEFGGSKPNNRHITELPEWVDTCKIMVAEYVLQKQVEELQYQEQIAIESQEATIPVAVLGASI